MTLPASWDRLDRWTRRFVDPALERTYQLADLLALLEVARGGVHDAEVMPFGVAWTDQPPPEFERSFLRRMTIHVHLSAIALQGP